MRHMHRPDILKSTVMIGDQSYTVKDLTMPLQNIVLDAIKRFYACSIPHMELIICPGDFPITKALPKENWANDFYPHLPANEYQIAVIWTSEWNTKQSQVYKVGRHTWWHVHGQMNVSERYIAAMRQAMNPYDAAIADTFGWRPIKSVQFLGKEQVLIRQDKEKAEG